jgi:enamine deaminase RidA (YjgF/YER057c/UK114 family)
MEEHMQAPSGNKPVTGGLASRLAELGIALPAPPTPLGAYVESSDTGNLLFLSGMLPVVNRKLAISGRLGEKLSVREGQQAARIASLNALAAAKQHLGSLDRLKKLLKLTASLPRPSGFSSTRQWPTEPPISLSRFLAARPATFGWCMESKAYPLARQS